MRENSSTILTTRLLEIAPTWLVVTREVWDNPKTQQAARDAVEVVGSFRGLDIADGMRNRIVNRAGLSAPGQVNGCFS